VNERKAEKIEHQPVEREDQPTFLVNALQPAEVTKVVLDRGLPADRGCCADEATVAGDWSFRGQNVRLAAS